VDTPDFSGNDVVRIEVVGRVGVITLTRPDSRNALHPEMHAPIVEAITGWANDPDVGCIVLTGEGSAFCAGGDVRLGAGRLPGGAKPTPQQRADSLIADAQLSVLLHESPIITIAAVNGPAVGAGLALALACDLRIASSAAEFIGGWARLGFSGDYGGAWLLTHRVGASTALEMLATNRSVNADEALQMGLVDRVVANDQFEPAWREWAATFAAGPKTALGLMKANVLDAHRVTLAEAIAVESQWQVAASQTADHREAVRAWVERREPIFGQG
jgi:2-(1,2-epoxy-1,2-dihydrophenyl)acetyl-CoA isomerase